MNVRKKNPKNLLAQFFKRSIDLTGSFVGLVLSLPLFIVVPVLIKFESEGPVIYKRKVVGQDGIPFSAYKFRTMVKDADKILENDPKLNECFLECFKLKQDPRITRIGYFLRKYSLDEIPQLINVLRGQMSLVGPRMMTVMELEEYGEYMDLILSVRPGLTGLWQVSGRQDVSFQRRVELDVYYVNNWSFWKDVVLILKTFRVVLNCEGAY
jgi:lipopolysaccharide/colanic/teichoic acid biosynthesis glycosyltransferase